MPMPIPGVLPEPDGLMLGHRPSTTGIYNNGQWWLPHLPDAVSLPMHFKRHGYETMGAGKIFHHTAGFNPPVQWDDFQRLVFRTIPGSGVIGSITLGRRPRSIPRVIPSAG